MSRVVKVGWAEKWSSGEQRCGRLVNRNVEIGLTEMWRIGEQRCEGRVGREVEVGREELWSSEQRMRCGGWAKRDVKV